ncbi:hypothetical protein CXB51_033294 [Gossypium anomalum]|uniref:CCT domain-containing protein n=1 Tax=Gossypium anomalum TaxID=47600 RepID=A0A8J5YUH5_9ROSI|nr:hypothetical protein CXB51_033294 [Gossypium anomalum]
MQNFAQDFQQFEDYYKTQKPNASMYDLAETSTISEYNLEGEGDLFSAETSTISEYNLEGEGDLAHHEEPIVGLDSMTAAISLISCGEDVITSQELKAADIESFQNEQLLEVLYECEKDLLARGAIGTAPAAVLDIDTPVVKTNESQNCDASFDECVSSDCLSSMECMQGAAVEPNFLDFTGMDFGSVYGMRRAFSEGDIKVSLKFFSVTLGNGDVSVIHSSVKWPSCSSEDRREKLSRYRNKKTKRNFGRKIKLFPFHSISIVLTCCLCLAFDMHTALCHASIQKLNDTIFSVQYACRKALADSQPRIHGRFAKTEVSDNSKRQLWSAN